MSRTRKLIVSLLLSVIVLSTFSLYLFNTPAKADEIHREILSQCNYGETDALKWWDGAINGEYAPGSENVTITRKVYALGVNDITDYLGEEKISSKDLMKLFFNIEEGNVDENIWLRSADSNYEDIAFFVNGDNATLDGIGVDFAYSARPAFQINLLNTSYDMSGKGVPVKGDIIMLDVTDAGGQTFRVLNANDDGSNVELLAMDSITDVQFNYNSTKYSAAVSTPDMPEGDAALLQQYCFSDLDIALNHTYLDTLKQEIKDAIISHDIIQDNYYFMGKYDWGDDTEEPKVIDPEENKPIPKQSETSVDDGVNGKNSLDSIATQEGAAKGAFPATDEISKVKGAKTGDFTMLFAGLVATIGLTGFIMLIALKKSKN